MESSSTADRECVFCDIVAGAAEASVVYEDDAVIAFMDVHPVTVGHLLVVPRTHVGGLDELPTDTGSHVWSVGQDLARALRGSGLRCDGINLLVCDGAAAFQTVFHFHLHVIPRHVDDGWVLPSDPPRRDRSLLDADAAQIVAALR